MTDSKQHPKEPATLPDTTAADDTLHISSLRPTAGRFSLRRSLNAVSLVVVIVVLALAIHWLLDVLPTQTRSRTTSPTTPPRYVTSTPTQPRGIGWKRSGPGWAQSVGFAPDGSLGYACGSPSPGNGPILFTVYDVSNGIWRQPTGPVSGATCRVVVSPISANDLLLVVSDCMNCADMTNHVYRSHDRGNTWSPVSLPASFTATDFAWTTAALFMAAQNSSALTINAHLFVIHDDNSSTEIPTSRLLGYPAQMDNISLLSSGLIIYATVDPVSCSSDCATMAYSTDDGAHWDRASASYEGARVRPVAIKSGVNDLLAWVRLQSPATQQVLLHSSDSGQDWLPLPTLPSYPTNCAQIFYSIDNAIYIWCYEPTNVVYKLQSSAGDWQVIAPVSTGVGVTVQYDGKTKQAVALWALAGDTSDVSRSPGLEYYPLTINTASVP